MFGANIGDTDDMAMTLAVTKARLPYETIMDMDAFKRGLVRAMHKVGMAHPHCGYDGRFSTRILNGKYTLKGGGYLYVSVLPPKREFALDFPIENLDLSVRAYTCLKRSNINTIDDLMSMTEDDLIKVRNLGRKSLEEVLGKISALGIELRKDEQER